MGVRAAMQAGQIWCQAVTTNVPGPRVPLYVLGRRMVSATAYVPIAGGTRVSIGIFSYLNTMTFGVNADFDAFPDVDVLSNGIRRGIEELLHVAGKLDPGDVAMREKTAARAKEGGAGAPKKGPAKQQPRKRAAPAGTS
jgi:hypothetical protein